MSNDKKDAIISAAIALFAEKGFEGTSIRDIAARADVNLAMINYYFGSKEGLFAQLVESKSNYTREALLEITSNDTLSHMEKIDQVIVCYVTRLFSNRKFHRVISQELMLAQREELQQYILNMMYNNNLLIRKIIEDGISEGTFNPVDPQLTLSTLVGTLNQLLLSKSLCLKLFNKAPDYVPYEDEDFKERVILHLQHLMHSFLLKKEQQ